MEDNGAKSTIIGYTRIFKLCNDGKKRRNRFGTNIYVKNRFKDYVTIKGGTKQDTLTNKGYMR